MNPVLVSLSLVLPWLLLAFGAWLFTQFLRQNGRILLRLEALQDQMDQLADALPQGGNPASNGHHPLVDSKINRDGLPAGTPAPDFKLPRLDGGELSLSEYRGKKVLLVFTDPHCGPCEALMPDLEKAHNAGARGSGFGVQGSGFGVQGSGFGVQESTPTHAHTHTPIQILMVSRGEIADNRKKVKQHKLTFPIVLQKRWEISKQYAMFATPVGYLIDEEGITLADVAVGADAILALLTGSPAKELAPVA